MTSTRADDEARIRALIDAQAEAIRAKDVEGSVAGYASDVLLFDVVNPLRSVGSDAVRERLAAWFASFRGPISYEHRDLNITAGDDVAFAHSLNRVQATMTDGRDARHVVARDRLLSQADGRWLVTHEHASVPFDAASGRASLDLEP